MRNSRLLRTKSGLTLSSVLISVLVLHTVLAFSQNSQLKQRPKSFHPLPVFDNGVAAGAALQTWNGSFIYQGKSNAFTMVGTDPSSSNVTTTVPVFIIPLKVVLTS